MSLTTGDFKFYYPATWPHITGLGNVGGTINSGSEILYSATTGIFPTGLSAVNGASPDIWYTKIFVQNRGDSTLNNPILFITNEHVSSFITMAPDPYWISGRNHVAQTGLSASRRTLPSGLVSGDFVRYTPDSPLDLRTTTTSGSVTMASGEYIGLWLKMRVPAGLSTTTDNTFSIGIRGTT